MCHFKGKQPFHLSCCQYSKLLLKSTGPIISASPTNCQLVLTENKRHIGQSPGFCWTSCVFFWKISLVVLLTVWNIRSLLFLFISNSRQILPFHSKNSRCKILLVLTTFGPRSPVQFIQTIGVLTLWLQENKLRCGSKLMTFKCLKQMS